MKTIQKRLLLLAILVLALSLAACNGKEPSLEVIAKSTIVTPETSMAENTTATAPATVTTEKNPAAAETTSETKSDFIYTLIDETYTEKGITIKFPQLTKTNDPPKGDSINKVIQEGIRNKLDSLRNGNEDLGPFTLDLKYQIAGYLNKVLSISYQGSSFFEKAAYPVDIYYTQNITLDDVNTLPLKDIFTIDAFFVEQFKSGMYSPTRDDLDLEKSGVNLKETIESQYSDADLIALFQQEDANYKLTQYGVILSIEVPHALGDHLEMAINYESIEKNIIKSSPVWKDYLFLDNNS